MVDCFGPCELDRVVQLPGQPPKSLFYYFAEAEFDPFSKPLVLWLNGGPGCSSLGVGAFSENGPFRPNGQVLIRNEHSWNTEANMLYLEAPIGVGFPYAADSSAYDGVTDLITARDNLAFLQKWFLKFPQYKNRSLFITGERLLKFCSILDYELLDLEIPTIGAVGRLVKAGIPVLVYRLGLGLSEKKTRFYADE
ncbi:unnamed protein product [Linum tenue]|uniref:Uncharacterized protein n=1 Tax=Linum tenue TaxID=586396 RepID=A0AAV0NYE2_9ROSI|nr:unnamed protein product [Linum tenue]